ncbi:DUF2125 domain-containing protein, partial [Mesorhizobium sp.]|uniref:DUF2125 domain-containing protein n=1 Tax=Mesorhizobium sp. TaxID=1871066 RepID=UPI0025FBD8C7
MRQPHRQRLSDELHGLLRQHRLRGRRPEGRRFHRELQRRSRDHRALVAGSRPARAAADDGARHAAALDRLGPVAGQCQSVVAAAAQCLAAGRRPERSDRPAGRHGSDAVVQRRHVTLKNGVALIAAPPKSLRGQSIEIAKLDLSSGTARITVSGPVSIDAEGLVDASLMIKLKDPKAVAAILAGAVPEHKSEIEQGFAALAMLGKEP